MSAELDKINLTRFDFDDFLLDSDDMLRATFRMYKNSGLLEKFKIDNDVSTNDNVIKLCLNKDICDVVYEKGAFCNEVLFKKKI